MLLMGLDADQPYLDYHDDQGFNGLQAYLKTRDVLQYFGIGSPSSRGLTDAPPIVEVTHGRANITPPFELDEDGHQNPEPPDQNTYFVLIFFVKGSFRFQVECQHICVWAGHIQIMAFFAVMCFRSESF